MSAYPEWLNGVHHDGSPLYVSDLTPRIGDTVTIRLRVPRSAPVDRVFLRARPDGEFKFIEMRVAQRDAASVWWQADYTLKQHRNNYCFKLFVEEGHSYHINGLGAWRGDAPDWFNFTILADYSAPAWVRQSVFYQIFPERFHNGDPTNDVRDGQWEREGKKTRKRNWDELPIPWRESRSLDFFGGDLQGITQKLPYLRDLGVNALYLTPIFDADSNHFYDIKNFNKVAEHLGGDSALADLRRATQDVGIRLILDITPNHIGSRHPWFLAAQQDPQSPTAEYFIYHPDSQSFEYWLGVPTLIKLNYTSRKLRDAIYGNPDSPIRHWLKPPYSIDGWRLDVANMTGNFEVDQLDAEVWREMREAIKAENPIAYMMGEYFQDGTPNIQGDQLDATMNYQGFNIPVRRWLGGRDIGVDDGMRWGDPTPLPSEDLAQQWQHYLVAIPYVIALQQFNQISSHDITRIYHIVNGDTALVKLGTALLMTFPGVPCIYYGDEIGMDGGKDPDNRRPMRWDPADWNQDLRAYHQTLIALRKSAPALQHGGFHILRADGDLIAYQRHAPEQHLVIVGYRGSDSSASFAIPVWRGGLADGRALKDLLGGQTYTVTDGQLVLTGLKHGQALILEAQ